MRLGVMGVEGVVDRTVVSQRGNDSTNELLSVYLEDMPCGMNRIRNTVIVSKIRNTQCKSDLSAEVSWSRTRFGLA